MKRLDMIIGAILVIGGLNWGLVGLFQFDLVAAIFGELTFLSRIAYVIVGLAAVYDIVFIKAIFSRWNIHPGRPAHP